MIKFHFINVGQGNMAIGIFPNGEVLVYDCNITTENETAVFNYLEKIMPKKAIDIFTNSHRDSDHTRGIKKLNERYPIAHLWDSGVPANTDAPEYQEYMDLRRSISFEEVGAGRHWIKYPDVRILNGKRDGLNDPNSQSIVLHINHNGSQLLLAGDTTASVWKDFIIPEVGDTLSSLAIYASHHGSRTFFNENPDSEIDYTDHLIKINPAVAVISVGADNPHGHPHQEALDHYARICYGTVEEKYKYFRTDQHGNMQVELHGQGTGRIYWNLI